MFNWNQQHCVACNNSPNKYRLAYRYLLIPGVWVHNMGDIRVCDFHTQHFTAHPDVISLVLIDE